MDAIDVATGEQVWSDAFPGRLDQPVAISGGRIFLPLSSGFTVAGQAVTAQLDTSAAPADHAWSLAAGTLPPGLAVAANGALSGTPTTIGTSVLTVRVTDHTQADAVTTVAITVTVVPAP